MLIHNTALCISRGHYTKNTGCTNLLFLHIHVLKLHTTKRRIKHDTASSNYQSLYYRTEWTSNNLNRCLPFGAAFGVQRDEGALLAWVEQRVLRGLAQNVLHRTDHYRKQEWSRAEPRGGGSYGEMSLSCNDVILST